MVRISEAAEVDRAVARLLAHHAFIEIRSLAGLGVLAGWPVRTPAGRQPLPRQARVLKAVDRDGMCALYEDAGKVSHRAAPAAMAAGHRRPHA